MSKNSARILLLFPVLVLFSACGSAVTAANQASRPSDRNSDSELLPVDPSLYDVAAATGGDFFLWAPGEFATASAELKIQAGGEPIVLSYGGSTQGEPRVFEMPVDAQIIGFDVFVSAQRLEVATLYRPDGTEARSGDSGVGFQRFEHMAMWTVNDVDRGAWRLKVTAEGRRTVTARARMEEANPIRLTDFAFLEFRGRPGHQTQTPIEGNPVAGASLRCSLRLSGSWSTARFELVSFAGDSLEPLNLNRLSGSEFAGKCTVPAEPFRVVARGRDETGSDFRRITSASWTPVGAE